MIDPRAIIDPSANLGSNVQIGAWSVVGENVHIGDNSVLAPHVVVQAGSILGSNVQVGPFAVIGSHPLAPAFITELPDSLEPVAIADGAVIAAQTRVTHSIAGGAADGA